MLANQGPLQYVIDSHKPNFCTIYCARLLSEIRKLKQTSLSRLFAPSFAVWTVLNSRWVFSKCKIPARRQINIVLFRYVKLIVQFPSPYFSKRAFLPCRIQYSAIKCSRTAPFETGPMVPNNNSITVGRIHLACFSPVRGVTCFGEDAAYARVLFLAPGLRRTPQDPREWKYRPHGRGDYFLL